MNFVNLGKVGRVLGLCGILGSCMGNCMHHTALSKLQRRHVFDCYLSVAKSDTGRPYVTGQSRAFSSDAKSRNRKPDCNRR